MNKNITLSWTPVSRKPKETGNYLITRRGWVGDRLIVTVAYYGKPYGHNKKLFYNYDSEWGDVILDDVIAWMPLPEPYDKER